jgi:arabinogalactan oligomer/maltooligosaccharide transport system substrate-binding protein
MRHPVAALILSLTCLSVQPIHALSVQYNGKAMALPPARDLVMVAPGESGISLAGLFQPQLAAWSLEIDGQVLADDELGERLHEFILIRTSAGWDLARPAYAAAASAESLVRIRDIRNLALRGEPCPERSLEVWVSWEGVPALKAEIAAWAARAGVTVKVVDVPSIKSKLITVLRGGGKVPDVVMVQSDYLPDLSAAGALQELDRLVLPAALSKGRKAFTIQGRLLAAPFYCDTQLVFYSTSLVTTPPRVDWSLADMERLAFSTRAVAPAAWNAYSAYWFLPFAAGFGRNPIISDTGRMELDDPAWARAMQYLKSAADRKFMVAMERDAMMAYFTSGRAAFILSGSYSLPEFRRLGIPFGVAPFPLSEPAGRPVAPLLDYKGFAVTRTTKNPILARRLIQYLSTAAIQARFCEPQGKLPANEAAWALLPADDPYRAIVEQSYHNGIVVPPEPVYAEFKNAMWKLLRLYLGGSMSLSETIAAARTIIGER